ncbi:hypothetical protein HID58_062614, partial [Brassica napus]
MIDVLTGLIIIIFSISRIWSFFILLNHRSLKIINHNAIFKWSYKTETYSQNFQNNGLVWSKYCIRSKLYPGNQVHKTKL